MHHAGYFSTMDGHHLVLAYLTVFSLHAAYVAGIAYNWLKLDKTKSA